MNSLIVPSAQGTSKYANVLFVLTVLYFFLSIALVRFMVGGLPVRSLFGLGIFLIVYAMRPALIIKALLVNWKIIVVISYAALVGMMVSLFNDAPLADTLRQLLEIHFQAVICLLTGYGLLQLMGAKRLVYAFLAIVLLSSFFALLQAANVDIGWTVRDNLQKFQVYDNETMFLSKRMRAMGLSFSPVHLGTQICLAFAALFIFYSRYQQSSRYPLPLIIFFWLGVMLFVALASGNRSPILGFVVFAAAYIFYLRPTYSLMAGLLLLPIFGLLYLSFVENMDYFADTEIRALRVGDKSSEGREALRAYGSLLFAHQPFGYGLTFSSLDRVNDFWPELAHYENAETVFTNAVHNYYLNVILKYGILILPIALFCFYYLGRTIIPLLAFMSYAIHIYFHNDGPLQGDFMIWYFLPLFYGLPSFWSSKTKTEQEFGLQAHEH